MNNILEKQKLLTEMYHSAPIAKTTGITLEYNDLHQAVFYLKYNPSLDHGMGGIFGGTLATLIDLAAWFTAAPQFDHWILTVEYTTRIVRESSQIDLWARGINRKIGRKTAFTDVEITDKEKNLIAYGSGTFRSTSRTIKKIY